MEPWKKNPRRNAILSEYPGRWFLWVIILLMLTKYDLTLYLKMIKPDIPFPLKNLYLVIFFATSTLLQISFFLKKGKE